ncbi:MAG: CinA family nicotinamide mononucleotide deamidase-related protein [Saprospiraceae bacterium]
MILLEHSLLFLIIAFSMKIGLICIGDELLLGQVIDTNSSVIGQLLAENGLSVHRKWTVGDKADEIQYALQSATECCKLIIMTGGLGPTKDDITKKIIAEFFKVELVFSEANYAHLKDLFSARNIELKEVHKVQCYVPSNAELLNNKVGTAMGMWIEDMDKIYISLPGVPDEMKFIMSEEAIPKLNLLAKELEFSSRTFHTCGISETDVAAKLEPLLADSMDFIQIAYLPSISQVRFRIGAFNHNLDYLNLKLEELTLRIRQAFGNMIFGEGNTNLALELGKLLQAKNWTLATVESCTGGAMAAKISSNPGSSEYFKGGLITYATEVKHNLLNIPLQVIEQYSVVSDEVARAMVVQTAKLLKAEMVISTTGIAGPTGGSVELPIGTIFIACGNENEQISKRLKLSKNRERNIEATSNLALNLAREWMLSKL